MRKPEVLQRLCALAEKVADNMFEESKKSHAHDCMCGKQPGSEAPEPMGFAWDEEIMLFIEEAVGAKISRMKSGPRHIDGLTPEQSAAIWEKIDCARSIVVPYNGPSPYIQAIKLYREYTGKGLFEGKQAIDIIMATNPAR